MNIRFDFMAAFVRIALSLLALVSTSLQADAEQLKANCSEHAPKEIFGSLSQEYLACHRRARERAEQDRVAERELINEAQIKKAYELSPSHSAMSYQRCLIDKIPNSQNDLAARLASQQCEQFPRYARSPKADFFGYDTASECFGDLAAETSTKVGTILIIRACEDLFPGTVR